MKHVFFTDDDEIMRRACVRGMSRALMDVTIHDLPSAEEALELAASLLASEGDDLEVVIVTDGNMVPEYSMDGDGLILRLREILGPKLKGALMISGLGDAWTKRAQEVGCELRWKPIGTAELRAIVEAFFDGTPVVPSL